MSFELKLKFSTLDEVQEAINKLNGISVEIEETEAPKKVTPKAKAAAATKEGLKPAAKKGKKAAPTVEELKAEILAHAPSGAAQADAIKEYVRSFGVTKISELDDEQRTAALAGAAEHFAAAGEEEEEDDPMA